MISEAIDEVFWMADSEVEKTFYASPGYEMVWGRSLKSLYENPQSYIDAIHPGDRDRVLVDYEVKKNGNSFDHEYRIIRPDGAIRWIWDRGFPIRDKTGKVTRYVGIARDITDRKQAEEELKKSKDRLRALSARIQSVREEERADISREIHDDLGQRLTGLKMDLGWILRHLPPDLTELKKKAQEMGQMINQTVGTVRRISTELHPRILDDFGLLAALEWQAKEFTNKTGITCLFRSTGRKLDLKPDLSIAVFRIFQETLTNVVRHSQATKVEASLKKDAKGLVLTIRDNGRGISDEEIAQSNSLGLVGMRERALIFGGTVEIKGRKGKGTTVTLRLPITK